jgi:hypothetical protein
MAHPQKNRRSYGTISVPERITDIRERRNYICRFIRNLAVTYQPEYFIYEAIEGVIYRKGLTKESNYIWALNGIKLIGAVEGIADSRRRPIYSITPMEWKNHFNIPMGKKAEGLDPKAIAIEVAKKEFNLRRVAEDPAEAALQGKALLERRNLARAGQLKFL